MPDDQAVKHRWRWFATTAGYRPVLAFLREQLTSNERAELLARMTEVRRNGMSSARHLREDLYEVRAQHDGRRMRVLFSQEGSKARILLGLEAFFKTTPKTPPARIAIAKKRLLQWRSASVGRKP